MSAANHKYLFDEQTLSGKINFAEEWRYWHPILIKKIHIEGVQGRSSPFCINQHLQKQHNQGFKMISSWSNVVHLVTLWSFPFRQFEKGKFKFQASFSLGSFVSDENIWNALSLTYKYLGANWLQAKSQQISKESVAIQTEKDRIW